MKAYEKGFPKNPIRKKAADFKASSRAAVSAHINAAKVYDFYKDVLKRDSIDGKGMELVSVVNCTYARDEPPPQWRNAVWWKDRMWYGQAREAQGKGRMRSYSRFLDIIAHELTHGVTKTTADLVYQGESGALNESFSDIFGIIIKNWDSTRPNATAASWNWEIGPGLGKGGLPLRDLSNPKRTGAPDHMNDFSRKPYDNGMVHTNSNIHNKAACHVFTATDKNNKPVFEAREVAILYYLCLVRLNRLATFAKTLQGLLDVAATYYAGNPARRDERAGAIRAAYEQVGIVL